MNRSQSRKRPLCITRSLSEDRSGKAAVAFTALFTGSKKQHNNIFPVFNGKGHLQSATGMEDKTRFLCITYECSRQPIPPFSSLIEKNSNVPKRTLPFLGCDAGVSGLRIVGLFETRKLWVNDGALAVGFTILSATGSGKSTHPVFLILLYNRQRSNRTGYSASAKS